MAKKTGVNAGIEQGMPEQMFERKIKCHSCNKEVEYTLGSKLFTKCPRCGKKMERCVGAEKKEARRLIKWDILRRSKRTVLSFGFFLTLMALTFNIVGLFVNLFSDGRWWLALCSLPLIILSYFCMRITKTQSASKKYKFYARLALIVNFVALGVMLITAIPPVTDWVNDLMGR